VTLPLTEQQEKLWRFIRSCERSPSFAEMSEAMGLSSKSGVHRLVRGLETKGFIRRTPGLTRAIVALDAPRADLAKVSTSELFAELERRGILLGTRQ